MVARFVRDEEAAGSNPVSPTDRHPGSFIGSGVSSFWSLVGARWHDRLVSPSEPLSSHQDVEMSTTLPDVLLKEGVNWTNITFKGKGFAWVNHPENRAMIKAHHDEREALMATAPGAYEAGWATTSSAWVRVDLELADPEEVFELLEEAWRMTATKRAIKTYDKDRQR